MSHEILIIGLPRIGLPSAKFKMNGLFISQKLLTFQLALLQRIGFRYTTLQEAFNKKGGKFAVITFDGGFTDILTDGLAILRKFQAPATVFVITNDVGKKQILWDDLNSDQPGDLLSWENLKFLQGEGWEIGSHNNIRIQLSRLNDADQEESILLSIEEISQQLGVEPVSFAYPFGDFKPKTKKILKGCGIKYAVTAEQTGTMKFNEKTDLLELPRISVNGRKIRHYFKILLDTTKAVGLIPTLQGLVKMGRINVQSVILKLSSI